MLKFRSNAMCTTEDRSSPLRAMHGFSGSVVSCGSPRSDELPQFLNVLRGDMSVVGPRPEDPKIVRDHYTGWMMETLAVRPGITSPGAVFYYACAEDLVDPDDPGRFLRREPVAAETRHRDGIYPARQLLRRSRGHFAHGGCDHGRADGQAGEPGSA